MCVAAERKEYVNACVHTCMHVHVSRHKYEFERDKRSEFLQSLAQGGKHSSPPYAIHSEFSMLNI